MTVVAGGGNELTAWVGEGTRDVVVGTIEAYSAATAADLESDVLDSAFHGRLRNRLDQLADLSRQIEETAGPVHLSGPAELIAEVVRATASQATHDLDSMVEAIADRGRALTDEDIVLLRAQTTTATTCVEALIACESTRPRA